MTKPRLSAAGAKSNNYEAALHRRAAAHLEAIMNTDPPESAHEAEELYLEHVASLDKGHQEAVETLCREHPRLEAHLRLVHADFVRAEDWIRVESAEGRSENRSELSPGTRIGDFRLVEPLGRGGQGEVWRAEQVTLAREVALKVLPPIPMHEPDSGEHADLRRAHRGGARSLAEARILASLDHPGIVKIHQIESTPEHLFICLELLDGPTFDSLVKTHGPMSASEAASVGVSLCRALAEIHSNGLLHLDVKPSNAMRTTNGRVVLLDFGLSSRTTEPESSDFADRYLVGPSPGGTPLFMSPEQAGEDGEISACSDLYSLGVLLYWLVSGTYPVEAKSEVALRFAITQGEVTPLVDRCSTVPDEFVSIVERAMQLQPKARFASAGEMEQALRKFLHGGGDPAETRDAASSFLSRALGGALLFGTLFVSSWWFYGWTRRAPEVVARFYKESGDGPIELTEQVQLRLEDRVYLELVIEEPLYVYVFNQDSEGRVRQLVPHEDTRDQAAPFLPGTHRLPQSDDALGTWEVTEAADDEHLLVIASRERSAWGEKLVECFPCPEQIQDTGTRPMGVRDLSQGQLEELAKAMQRGLGKEHANVVLSKAPDEWLKTIAEEHVSGGEYVRHIVVPQP